MISWEMDPIFEAVTQATEEAIDNALIAAKTMIGGIIGSRHPASGSIEGNPSQTRCSDLLDKASQLALLA
jgi:hypothetical protein